MISRKPQDQVNVHGPVELVKASAFVAGGSVSRLLLLEQGWERCHITVREYREIEAGVRSPSFETRDRICKLFGWPQSFL